MRKIYNDINKKNIKEIINKCNIIDLSKLYYSFKWPLTLKQALINLMIIQKTIISYGLQYINCQNIAVYYFPTNINSGINNIDIRKLNKNIDKLLYNYTIDNNLSNNELYHIMLEYKDVDPSLNIVYATYRKAGILSSCSHSLNSTKFNLIF